MRRGRSPWSCASSATQSSPRAGDRDAALRDRVCVAGASAGKTLYPLVSELAADGVPVAVSWRVLKLARQPYDRWLCNSATTRQLEEAYRAQTLFDAHLDDPECGYRLLADEARVESGEATISGSIDSRMKSNLAVNALNKAVAMRGDVAGCVVHSDRGSQFRSRKFLRALTRHRLAGSMGLVNA